MLQSLPSLTLLNLHSCQWGYPYTTPARFVDVSYPGPSLTLRTLLLPRSEFRAGIRRWPEWFGDVGAPSSPSLTYLDFGAPLEQVTADILAPLASFVALTTLCLSHAQPGVLLALLTPTKAPRLPSLQHFSSRYTYEVAELDVQQLTTVHSAFLHSYSSQLRSLDLSFPSICAGSAEVLRAGLSCTELSELLFRMSIKAGLLLQPNDPPLPVSPCLHTLTVPKWSRVSRAADLSAILSACPALRHLKVHGVEGFDALPVIGRQCPSLVTLWIEDSELSARDGALWSSSDRSTATATTAAAITAPSVSEVRPLFPALKAALIHHGLWQRNGAQIEAEVSALVTSRIVATVVSSLTTAPQLTHLSLRAGTQLSIADMQRLRPLSRLRSLDTGPSSDTPLHHHSAGATLGKSRDRLQRLFFTHVAGSGVERDVHEVVMEMRMHKPRSGTWGQEVVEAMLHAR